MSSQSWADKKPVVKTLIIQETRGHLTTHNRNVKYILTYFPRSLGEVPTYTMPRILFSISQGVGAVVRRMLMLTSTIQIFM